MSLQVRTQVSLKLYNSFAVEAQASHFAEAENDQQVREALSYAQTQQLPLLLLGGGSNLLLTADVEALVLRMASRGIRVLSDDGVRVVIEAEAGESWHPFVQWTLAQGFAGLENLSLIPGTVGAAPVQNIGAYGVELKDLFAGLTALDRHSGELREFSLQDCAFAYRDSLFKRESGRWVILRVRFALSRAAALHLDYGPVRQRLAEQGIGVPTALDVSQAICAIRSEKLPDPAELGNAGSFFKNPLVSSELAQRLRDPDYQVFFSRFIDHAERGAFFSQLQSLLSPVTWQPVPVGDPRPTWREDPAARPFLQIVATPLQGELWAYLYQRKLDKMLNAGDPVSAGLVHTVVEEFAGELATVIRRFLRLDTWKDTPRTACTGPWPVAVVSAWSGAVSAKACGAHYLLASLRLRVRQPSVSLLPPRLCVKPLLRFQFPSRCSCQNISWARKA